jgi:hypothetical protein
MNRSARKSRSSRLSIACGALLAIALFPDVETAAAGAAPKATSDANLWRAMFERDVDHLVKEVSTDYIYAQYGDPAAWKKLLGASITQAKKDAAVIDGYPSYRAAFQRFVVGFEDAHFNVHFKLASIDFKWAGFLVRYQGGRYVVDESERADVPNGTVIESCDGNSLNDWVDRVATFEGGPKGLETTRVRVGWRLFIDSGNPFYALPKSCKTGDREITVQWKQTHAGEWNEQAGAKRISEAAPTLRDTSSGIAPFGEHGAWVRMGTFMPDNAADAAQFTQVVENAPSLRDKDYVIIDVRGNSGGDYNWFMAFLRSFYGQDYADYYARARLEIAPVILSFGDPKKDSPGFSSETVSLQKYSDPPMDGKLKVVKVQKLPGGAALQFMNAPIAALPPQSGQPPSNPVRAKIYVLTDYGCASACIAFIDEMMRFPGVTQIGGETHIDRRSGGWPKAYDMPSGLADVRMGRMVREGRRRGENETWVPSLRFQGDLLDTDAVKKWILRDIVPHGGH